MGSSSSTPASSSALNKREKEVSCDDSIERVFVVERELAMSEIISLICVLKLPLVTTAIAVVYTLAKEYFSEKGISATHTGLLLETSTGHYYLVEYTNDSKAHLYEVEYPVKEKRNLFDPNTMVNDFVITKVLDDRVQYLIDPPERIEMHGYTWEKKRLRRKPSPEKTPDIAKREMEELMPIGYNLMENEVCHTALCRLLEKWGLLDDD
ncbi:hypothetical protein EC973_001448 [Apophysomyces ossiformis]|uniref:Uncharacterized protein n=1 Tax=Apophysomyces ossiformis TaxID=679940 RepID=A0A8H7BP02_9FUNG|nr:hypothetical protein EC973_001448 [Apophysomyces ossiformis]